MIVDNWFDVVSLINGGKTSLFSHLPLKFGLIRPKTLVHPALAGAWLVAELRK
jgi:hypothetical protein